MRRIYLVLFLLIPIVFFSQNTTFEGQVVDIENNPISFVNVLLLEVEGKTPIKGTVTDKEGKFVLEGLEENEYILSFGFIGFNTKILHIEPPFPDNLGIIVLEEAVEFLDESIIIVQTPTIKKETGKLIFYVENTSLSLGDTFNLLKNTPGVLVIGDNISIKNAPTTIYINGNRVYLSSSEVVSLLKNIDASVIKSVEVITIPSAKYDAEAGSVINIITSKAISIGYKGSITGNYEQAIFSKFKIGTSHFYKNDWLNFYASYSFNPRKEYKQDDNFVTFFNPNNEIRSFWESYFNKTTRSNGHQGNLTIDFTLNDKNSLSIGSNIFMSPNKNYINNVVGEIFNAQRQLDSTFVTKSSLDNDTSNLSIDIEHIAKIGNKGSILTSAVNIITYSNEQNQNIETDYFLLNGDFSRNNTFFTEANQDTDIFTGQIDFSSPLAKGSFETGTKYSYIGTKSGLEFFNVDNNIPQHNPSLSDLFIYNETILAGYYNYSKKKDKWDINFGLRGEYTLINGDSRSLGIVNTQEYLEFFPSITLQRDITDNHTLGISYVRRINRPRYQSLNPFKYFISDTNFNGGNPNLFPEIDDKYMISYTYKNKWFIDAYYIDTKDRLSVLTFQDNVTSTLQNIDANLINEFQYSIDITYISSLFSWWYLSAYTSSFYMENEFNSIASLQETYSHNTYGFFTQLFNQFTLSDDRSFTCDLTVFYLSDYIFGSYKYGNQLNTSLSFRKSLWNKRASITIGVDDIFDTFNVPVSSKYYNQENSYFAKAESRLFSLGFKYNFGNFKLRDNKRNNKTKEGKRLD